MDQLETALAHHTERRKPGCSTPFTRVQVGPEYMGLFEHDHGHLVELIESARRDRDTVDDLIKSFEAHMLERRTTCSPLPSSYSAQQTGTLLM